MDLCLSENRNQEVNNIRDKDAWTPLHRAASDGEQEVAKLLLNHGADVNKRDADGLTPLHISSSHDIIKFVSMSFQ